MDLSPDFEHSFTAFPYLIEKISRLKEFNLFITGGTGFFGCLLMECFEWIRNNINPKISVVALTRDATEFRRKWPRLADFPFLRLYEGNVSSFTFPEGHHFTHMIHGASEPKYKTQSEHMMYGLLGTSRMIEFAVQHKVENILYLSSGAVYGPTNTYSQTKRISEKFFKTEMARSHLNMNIARCFTFVGPYLNLNGPFAIGNFIRDALSGGPIIVQGDGTAIRSYLYGSDLTVWLLAILLMGEGGKAYNVGSEEDISICALALRVAKIIPGDMKMQVMSPLADLIPDRYVPSTLRAREELGLVQSIGLDQAIWKTYLWNLHKEN